MIEYLIKRSTTVVSQNQSRFTQDPIGFPKQVPEPESRVGCQSGCERFLAAFESLM